MLMLLVPAAGMTAWYLGLRDEGEVHEVAANALMLLAIAHALAALFHHYVLRDGSLHRMMRRTG